jgi:hypothetical protein
VYLEFRCQLGQSLQPFDAVERHPGLEIVRESPAFSFHLHPSFRTLFGTQIPLKPVVLKSGLSAASDAENTFRYKLVEYETDGGVQEYGPFGVAVWKLQMENLSILPVTQEGRLVGLITPDNIGEYIMVQRAIKNRRQASINA